MYFCKWQIYFCKWQMYLSTVCKVSVDCSAATPRPLRRPSSIPAITQTAPAASISYITNIWPMHVDIEHIYSKISSTHYPDWHDWDNVLIHWRPSIASLWQLSFLNGVLQSRTINDLKKINWDEEKRLENKQKKVRKARSQAGVAEEKFVPRNALFIRQRTFTSPFCIHPSTSIPPLPLDASDWWSEETSVHFKFSMHFEISSHVIHEKLL